MLKKMGWQPFEKYGITIFKKKSTQEYWALEAKVNGFGHKYSEIVARSESEAVVINLTENYRLNNKLKPRKIDEEDIL